MRALAVVGSVATASVIAVVLGGTLIPAVSLERFQLLNEFAQSALSGDLTTSVGDTSAGTRVELFRTAIQMFEERPIAGFGPGGFEAEAPRILGPAEAETYPHNAALQIAAELGIMGFAIFLLLAGLALFRRLPSEPGMAALRGAYIYFALNAMLSRGIYEDRTMWGVMVLILMVDLSAAAHRAGGSAKHVSHQPTHGSPMLASAPTVGTLCPVPFTIA
jgi:O-antigen ligase